MGLNTFRNEAGAFLAALGKASEGTNTVLSMLEVEMAELRVSLSDEPRLQHQLYDVLFLLFELAAQHNLDLDAEWQAGRARKHAKYLSAAATTDKDNS